MPDDPLNGQEISILNSLLPELVKKAKTGDKDATDQVIKILDLKRKYKMDQRIEDMN